MGRLEVRVDANAPDLARRTTVLAELTSTAASLHDIDQRLIDGAATDLIEDERALFRRSGELAREYLALLPRIALSRCPLTQAAVVAPVDTAGLDGPWWRYDSPLRPPWERPSTLVALTGALALGGAPEHTDDLVRPGPAVPYVIPRLVDDGCVAVLSSLPIGAHTGYVIAYFAEHFDTPRANDWGANQYPVDGGWDEVIEDASAFDFDLRPYVERGQLRWIAPGDQDLALHDDVEGCPYVDLPGLRAPQRIEGGQLW